MALGYYLPLILSYFGPIERRTKAMFVWQLFAVWVAIFQQLGRLFIANTMQSDRLRAPLKDLPVIRFTVGAAISLSTIVWWHTLSQAPISARELFIPAKWSADMDAILSFRTAIQYDHLFCWGSALLWMVYLFGDLKYAGMVKQSWSTLLTMGLATLVVAGPGATVGSAWLWREEVLASTPHEGAIVRGSESHVHVANGGANGSTLKIEKH
jgi:hypothetical protein